VNTGTAVGGYFTTEFGVILRTTNAGATWINQQPAGDYDWGRAVFFTDANTGTVVGWNGIRRTTNGGATWANQNSGTIEFLESVCFTDANTGTVVGWNGTILRTLTGGE